MQLLQRKIEAAAALYEAAVLISPLEHGNHKSTYKQAALLLQALGATGEQKALLAAKFPAANRAGHAGV